MKNYKDITKYFLILITVFLFVAMLVLCGMYLDLRINGKFSSVPGIPEKDKWILTGAEIDSGSASIALTSPVFIGYRNEEEGMVGAAFNADSRKDLLKKTDGIIPELFAGKLRKIKFTRQDDRDSYIKKLIESEKFFYMNYYSEIPSSVILADFGETDSKHTFFVKYIFVLPDKNGDLYGVFLNEDLEVFELVPGGEGINYDENMMFAYNGMRGFAQFEFVSDVCPEAVFTKSFEADSVMMVPSATFYEFEPDGDNTKRLLDTLNFNRNLVKSYKAADKTSISFVDDGRELYVDVKNSKITFNSQSRGIHISEYLKYTPNNNHYGFGDMLMCARRLISALDRLLTGGQAYPSVVGIYSSDEGITVDFKYFYNGILITDEKCDISISFKNDYIVSMNINAVFCDNGNNTDPVIPQKFTIDIPENKNDAVNLYYNAMYVVQEGGTDVEFVWVTRKKGEED